jgi:hypothetical protein
MVSAPFHTTNTLTIELVPGAGASRMRAAVEAVFTSKRQRKPRKPTLVGVAKQASKAAIEVARYEVKPDGTVVVVTGRPESTEPENPWLADLRKETKQ